MSRAKTQHGAKDKKALPLKPEPIDNDDIDAAFDGIRLDTPSPIAVADEQADAADAALDSGSEFSSAHTGLPEVKQAATSKRRAATRSEEIHEPRPPLTDPLPPTRPASSVAAQPPQPPAAAQPTPSLALPMRAKGTTTPPSPQIGVPARLPPPSTRLATPASADDFIEDSLDDDAAHLIEEENIAGQLVVDPRADAAGRTPESNDEWERMRAAADERAEEPTSAKGATSALAPDTQAPAGVRALAAAKAAVAKAAATKAASAPAATPRPVAAARSVSVAATPSPPSDPANDAALDASLASLATDFDEQDASAAARPNAVVPGAAVTRSEHPTSARAQSSFDIDLDEDGDMVEIPDNSRAARAERASANGLPPPARALDTAAREVAAEHEVALINQAAAAREDAALRVKAAKEAAAAKALAKAAKHAQDGAEQAQAQVAQVRATSEARAQAQARAAALSGGVRARAEPAQTLVDPRDVPRQPRALESDLPMTDSQRALERALRDSSPNVYPRPDSDDFSMPGAPMPQPPQRFAPSSMEAHQPNDASRPNALPRVELAVGNRPHAESVSESQVVSFVPPAPPQLQLAVFETGPNLQSVSLAIAGAGHAMSVGASGRDGIEQIKRALAEGQIDAVIVGMPGGEQIIEAALSLNPRAPVVIAACTGKATDAVREATMAGADLVAIRPHDPDRLAPVLLAAARILEQRHDVAAAQYNEADLLARLEAGEANSDDIEVGGLQPFDHFQRALELELKRVRRYQYALSVVLFALEIPDPSPPGIRGILRARAGNALVHSIRDIDLATEIDQDRFLVLLPYTDITGATEVARRIIAAVDVIPAVVAVGSSFRVGLTGAIVGAKPGTQLSFGKLIKDANRALAAARRDGAELAVQP